MTSSMCSCDRDSGDKRVCPYVLVIGAVETRVYVHGDNGDGFSGGDYGDGEGAYNITLWWLWPAS